MATEPFMAADFMGLTPGIDPTRSERFFALGGQNYIFDSIGPKSAFGNRFLLPQRLGDASYAQGVRIPLRTGDRVFHFFKDGIFEWNESNGGYDSIYLTQDTNANPNRWTWAYLNEYVYFCHPVAGLIALALESDTAFKVDSPGAPERAIAICENNGRLVAIDPEWLYWSEQSNGLAWTPSLGGAGFQKISDRLPGYPITVTSYTAGVLTWTTGGVMRSEFSGDKEVYRHRALNTEYRPVNSFCAQKVDDDTVVILDARGLFQTRGEKPTPFTPMFNEFFIGFVARNKLDVGQNLRLEWDALRRLMYVSISFSRTNPIFERCFVLYPPTDKWGTFNEKHFGILPISITDSQRADDYFGFVDEDKRVRYWQETGSRELMCDDWEANLYYPLAQKSYLVGDESEGWIVSSSGIINVFPTLPYKYSRAGFYKAGATSPVAPRLTSLDAWIHMGLLRFNAETSNDSLSEVTQVLVRSNVSGPRSVAGEDWNVGPPPDEDWNVDSGTDDFGLEAQNYVNSKVRLISTLDGLTEFQSAQLMPVIELTGARYYAGTTVGLWHILEIKADEVGEGFYLKSFELTWTPAGKLT